MEHRMEYNIFVKINPNELHYYIMENCLIPLINYIDNNWEYESKIEYKGYIYISNYNIC